MQVRCEQKRPAVRPTMVVGLTVSLLVSACGSGDDPTVIDDTADAGADTVGDAAGDVAANPDGETDEVSAADVISGDSGLPDAAQPDVAPDAIDDIVQADATDAVDNEAGDAADVTDAAQPEDASDTTDADAVDTADVADVADVTEPTDVTDAGDASDVADSVDVTDVVDATDTLDPGDATDVLDTGDVADDTELDAADDADTDADDVGDADVEEDVEEPILSSCTSVVSDNEGERRYEVTADENGKVVSSLEYVGGVLRTEMLFEYDAAGRVVTLQRAEFDAEAALVRATLQESEFTEDAPSLAGTLWFQEDSDGDRVFEFRSETIRTADNQELEYRESFDGVLSFERRYLYIDGANFLIHLDNTGTGSTWTYEMVGELPTPSRLTIRQPGVVDRYDFTWDEFGRPLTRVWDRLADGTEEERMEWAYPEAGVIEVTDYRGGNPIPQNFMRTEWDGERLARRAMLFPTRCQFNVVTFPAPGSPNEFSVRGQYDNAPANCLAANRLFPVSGYLSETEEERSACGLVLLRDDENANGIPESLVEITYDEQCSLLTDYYMDGSPGFEDLTLLREGVPTYTAEGWLTSLIITSFVDYLPSSTLTRTWDERGNMLTEILVETGVESGTTTTSVTRTFDAANRELTRVLAVSSAFDGTSSASYTYTYDGDWSQPTCLDDLPPESDE